MVACKYSLLALGFSVLAAAQGYPPAGGSSSSAAASATSSAPSGPATAVNGVIDIQVGTGVGYNYTPSIVQAQKGDIINFHFLLPNHSVGESTFESPCSYKPGGIWSGWFPTNTSPAPQMFSLKINDTNTRWLFCAQNQFQDCQMGMAMVINPPANSNKTLDAYMAAAKGTKTSTAGPFNNPIGGLVAANVAAASPSSSSTPSTGATVDVSPRGWLAMVASLGATGLWLF